eukprot:TRINITY_DN21493_c0_g2_i1.p1 TRINITY_DN21493_c0_g2~~TRINITY_DN21493_c0_g2_i1.p1  ORF type:complete len:147 (+),score=31.94 TRINITY_DN21493_c0_g2_i1:174-614(+)
MCIRDRYQRRVHGDTWISAYSIKIQRPNTISKLGTVYCRRILDDEYPAPDDSKDVLLNAPVKGDNVVVIHRAFRSNSSLYLELIQTFGINNGFDLFTQKIKTEKFSVSLEFIIAAIELASGPHYFCLLYTSPSPRDLSTSRMPSSA